MTEQPIASAAGRGAVDLSGMSAGGPAPTAPGGAAPTGPAVPAGLVREVTDADFSEALNATLRVPAVLVLWSSRLAESRTGLDQVTAVAATLGGRLQVLSCDVDTSPAVLQAFRIQTVPMVFGVVQGQPVPLFQGMPDEAQVRAGLDQLVQYAIQNGVTGRLELGPAGPAEEPEASDPHHDAAYDAIERGDFDGARAAYEAALAANPQDEEARLGLSQVALLQRTAGVDLHAARAAAAAAPEDLDAAFVVADLDLLGGHVEDAFGRLLDLVRSTAGEERDRVKERLLELLAVVGNADPRVKKARTALMSALF